MKLKSGVSPHTTIQGNRLGKHSKNTFHNIDCIVLFMEDSLHPIIVTHVGSMKLNTQPCGLDPPSRTGRAKDSVREKFVILLCKSKPISYCILSISRRLIPGCGTQGVGRGADKGLQVYLPSPAKDSQFPVQPQKTYIGGQQERATVPTLKCVCRAL